MWFKAILWPLSCVLLSLVLLRVAKPAIDGWPDRFDADDVNTPALEWLKVLDLAAVLCKCAAACSRVRFLSVTVSAQACDP